MTDIAVGYLRDVSVYWKRNVIHAQPALTNTVARGGNKCEDESRKRKCEQTVRGKADGREDVWGQGQRVGACRNGCNADADGKERTQRSEALDQERELLERLCGTAGVANALPR